jgi:acetyl esterase
MNSQGASSAAQAADLTGPRIRPEVARYLALNPDGSLQWDDIEALRRTARDRALEVRGALEPVFSSEDLDASGVPVRLVIPSPDVTDVLVWVHGGGWIHGDLDGYDGVARSLANRARCAVVSVDYRLAPEHPFPAGLEDVLRVLDWARSRYTGVAVGGDSSGGNIAAAACLAARERQLDLVMQLLVYPVLDHGGSDYKAAFRRGYRGFVGQPDFGTAACERIAWLWDQYDPEGSHRDDPLAAPLRAASLSGLPPATVILAEHDVLRGEGELYADRLDDAGVPVDLLTFPGQIHGFLQMAGVTPDARRALDLAGAAIREAFDSTSQLSSTTMFDQEEQR